MTTTLEQMQAAIEEAEERDKAGYVGTITMTYSAASDLVSVLQKAVLLKNVMDAYDEDGCEEFFDVLLPDALDALFEAVLVVVPERSS